MQRAKSTCLASSTRSKPCSGPSPDGLAGGLVESIPPGDLTVTGLPPRRRSASPADRRAVAGPDPSSVPCSPSWEPPWPSPSRTREAGCRGDQTVRPARQTTGPHRQPNEIEPTQLPHREAHQLEGARPAHLPHGRQPHMVATPSVAATYSPAPVCRLRLVAAGSARPASVANISISTRHLHPPPSSTVLHRPSLMATRYCSWLALFRLCVAFRHTVS